MKLQLVIFQLVCLTVAWARTAVDDEQSEEGPVQPFKTPPRQSPLKSSKSLPSAAAPKAAPAPAPQQSAKGAPAEEEKEYVDDGEPQEYEDDVSSSTVASTTAATKKIGLSVRPFRSNQDLLETLKRRRQEKAAAGPSYLTTSTTSAPVTASGKGKAKPKPTRNYGGRSRTYSEQEPDQAGSESEKRTTVNRRFSGSRGRGGFSTTPQTYEEVPEEEVEPQPPRSKNLGRSRRV